MTDRRTQLRVWLLALDRFELRLRGKIARQRGAFIIAASNTYELNASVPTWLLAAHKNKIADILAAHYQAVIPYFGNMVLKQVKSRRISHKKASSLFSAFMLEWVKTESLSKATLISSTDSDDIRNAIQNSIESGVGIAEVARDIRKVSSLTPFRAATVARTETHNAATFGSVETARAAEQDIGIVLMKEWLPTLDERTRESHRAMAGKGAIELGARFEVDGESLDRPGDPSGSAGNIINCRCGIIYEEKQ